MDILTPKQRSERMRRVRQKNTAPELIVRRMLHRMGYRYRLHRRDLPGSPDIVFPTRRKIIFVHGCFWHGHADPECKLSTVPKTRVKFWKEKLAMNRRRDQKKINELKVIGWTGLVVWQCQIKHRENLSSRLSSFLE